MVVVVCNSVVVEVVGTVVVVVTSVVVEVVVGVVVVVGHVGVVHSPSGIIPDVK